MQGRILVLLIVLSSIFSTYSAIAQQDTVTISYSEELADSSSFSIKEKYKYWTRANVEEKSMFKIGIPSASWGGGSWPSISYYFAYEQKVSIPLSLLIQYQHRTGGWEAGNSFGADVALRYYYLLPKKVKQEKRANNLSSIYLSLQHNNSWYGYRDVDVINGSIVTNSWRTAHSNSFSLLQGIQLRLGRYGYLDANLGYRYNPFYRNSRGSVDGNFSIGIAF